MNFISPPDTPPVPKSSIETVPRSQWSFGRVLSRAMVIVIGVVVGFFIAIFIGLVTGWISLC